MAGETSNAVAVVTLAFGALVADEAGCAGVGDAGMSSAATRRTGTSHLARRFVVRNVTVCPLPG